MTERDDEKVLSLLRAAVPPLKDPGLKRDLWPAMLRKLDEQPIRVSWLDWALVAFVAAWLFVFPEVIPAVLYQL